MIVVDLLQGDVQLVSNDLGEGGTQTLADFAVTCQDLDGAVGILVQLGNSLDVVTLAGAGEAGAVEVPGHADTAAVTTGLGLGVLLVLCEQVGLLVDLVQHVDQRHGEVVDTGGGGAIALLDNVVQLELDGILAQILCDVVHEHLNREEGLRSAEATVCTGGSGVGLQSAAADVQVLNVVNAGSSDDTTLQNDSRQGGVSAAVELDVDVHCGDLAVLDSDLVGVQRGMTLGGELQVLITVEGAADSLACLLGSNSNLAAQDGGECFLTAEAAAGDVLQNMDAGGAAAQCTGDCAVDVVSTLHGAMDEHAAISLRLSHHALALDVGLILVTGLELLDVDLVSLSKCLLQIALAVLVVEVGMGGQTQIQNGLQLLVLDLDILQNVTDNSLIGAADHADGLADVLDDLICIDGGIVHDDVDVVVTGDVVAVNVEVALGQLGHLNGQDLSASILGPQHLAGQDVADIVTDVAAAAGDLSQMVLFHNGLGNFFHENKTSYQFFSYFFLHFA